MNRSIFSPIRTAGVVTACFVLAFTVAGCTGPQPRPIAGEPIPDRQEEDLSITEEPVPPPVLTIDETYEAIALSVQAGDPELAIAAYQEAEIENPDDPGTTVLLANLYLIAGATAQAESLLGEVLAEDPGNVDALFLSSLVAAASGDRDRQLTILGGLLELDPSNPKALASIGEIQLQNRQYAAAEGSFAAALSEDEGNLVARMGLANVYLRQEEYEAAEVELTTVIDSEPDYPYSYADRARARAMQHQLGGAAADLSIAIALDPGYQWHFIDRGRVYLEQGRYEAAETDFSDALALDDDQFITHILRGRARDGLGRTRDALVDYETGLQLRPDYYPAYAPYATLLYLSQNYMQAATYYQEAFDSDQRRLEYVLMATLALNSAGENSSADAWLTDNLSKFPRESVQYQMARYYLGPTNEGYIFAEISREQNNTVKGQMYFYIGAYLALVDRHATAQAALLEAEDLLSPGILERRLATWHLETYRTVGPEGQDAEEGH
jgi:tetratricopeptide (TPR) repeat protein